MFGKTWCSVGLQSSSYTYSQGTRKKEKQIFIFLQVKSNINNYLFFLGCSFRENRRMSDTVEDRRAPTPVFLWSAGPVGSPEERGHVCSFLQCLPWMKSGCTRGRTTFPLSAHLHRERSRPFLPGPIASALSSSCAQIKYERHTHAGESYRAGRVCYLLGKDRVTSWQGKRKVTDGQQKCPRAQRESTLPGEACSKDGSTCCHTGSRFSMKRWTHETIGAGARAGMLEELRSGTRAQAGKARWSDSCYDLHGARGPGRNSRHPTRARADVRAFRAAPPNSAEPACPACSTSVTERRWRVLATVLVCVCVGLGSE